MHLISHFLDKKYMFWVFGIPQGLLSSPQCLYLISGLMQTLWYDKWPKTGPLKVRSQTKFTEFWPFFYLSPSLVGRFTLKRYQNYLLMFTFHEPPSCKRSSWLTPYPHTAHQIRLKQKFLPKTIQNFNFDAQKIHRINSIRNQRKKFTSSLA